MQKFCHANVDNLVDNKNSSSTDNKAIRQVLAIVKEIEDDTSQHWRSRLSWEGPESIKNVGSI